MLVIRLDNDSHALSPSYLFIGLKIGCDTILLNNLTAPENDYQ
jgi:hypothetical protein